MGENGEKQNSMGQSIPSLPWQEQGQMRRGTGDPNVPKTNGIIFVSLCFSLAF